MSQSELSDFVDRAEKLYESRLRQKLERDYLHLFVAIEPESGDHYLGKTLSEAMGAAHRAHPGRMAHAMRVGHTAALHFGVTTR